MTYTPVSLNIQIDENSNYTFSVDSISGGYGSYTFQYFLDTVLESITQAWTYVGSIGEYGIKNVQVLVNDTFGTGAQSINWTINITQVYFAPNSATLLTPVKGYYDYTIPIQCGGAIIEYPIDGTDLYYLVEYSVNGGSWNTLFNNTKGLGKFDTTTVDYNDTVDFRCSAHYGGINSTIYNPTGNITRQKVFGFFYIYYNTQLIFLIMNIK
jgi:hypothetical protein